MTLYYHIGLSITALFCIISRAHCASFVLNCNNRKPHEIPCEYNRTTTVKDGTVNCCMKNKMICTVFCNKGYVRVGRFYNECYKDKTWRFPFAECLKKVDCIHPEKSKLLPRTRCTEIGCYTDCIIKQKTIGEVLLTCDWLNTHSNDDPRWPKCLPSYLNDSCTEEEHTFCFNSKLTCNKDTEVPYCHKHCTGKPECKCLEIGTIGNCQSREKVECQKFTRPDCFFGKNGYNERRSCTNPTNPDCTCKSKKVVPCPELKFTDYDRECHLVGEGPDIQCHFTCGRGERMKDSYNLEGVRICKSDGKWDYPPYVHCINEWDIKP